MVLSSLIASILLAAGVLTPDITAIPKPDCKTLIDSKNNNIEHYKNCINKLFDELESRNYDIQRINRTKEEYKIKYTDLRAENTEIRELMTKLLNDTAAYLNRTTNATSNATRIAADLSKCKRDYNEVFEKCLKVIKLKTQKMHDIEDQRDECEEVTKDYRNERHFCLLRERRLKYDAKRLKARHSNCSNNTEHLEKRGHILKLELQLCGGELKIINDSYNACSRDRIQLRGEHAQLRVERTESTKIINTCRLNIDAIRGDYDKCDRALNREKDISAKCDANHRHCNKTLLAKTREFTKLSQNYTIIREQLSAIQNNVTVLLRELESEYRDDAAINSTLQLCKLQLSTLISTSSRSAERHHISRFALIVLLFAGDYNLSFFVY